MVTPPLNFLSFVNVPISLCPSTNCTLHNAPHMVWQNSLADLIMDFKKNGMRQNYLHHHKHFKVCWHSKFWEILNKDLQHICNWNYFTLFSQKVVRNCFKTSNQFRSHFGQLFFCLFWYDFSVYVIKILTITILYVFFLIQFLPSCLIFIDILN